MVFKNTLLPVQTTLESRGMLLDLSTPSVMGILNSTPDSFYNRGRDSTHDALLRSAEKMLRDGAVMLDAGGVSTRPGAPEVSLEEERARIIPLVESLVRAFPGTWISVDTSRADIASEAVAAGASVVNDISAGTADPGMLAAVAALKVPYILMHMQGTPQTMQQKPVYVDVVAEVRSFLADRVMQCEEAGIRDILVDPGFGFGKTTEHNYALLRDMHVLRVCGRPVLAGISRKSMISGPLGVTPDAALNGTTALHMVALQQGAQLLRVHDVREATEVIRLYRELYG